MVDTITRDEGVSVSCVRKAIDFRKSVALSAPELDPQWKTLTQNQLRELYGRDGGVPVISEGWVVSTTVTTFDGKSFTMFADCSR
jgi:hypothetical protein